jgi:sugar transferase EpsL
MAAAADNNDGPMLHRQPSYSTLHALTNRETALNGFFMQLFLKRALDILVAAPLFLLSFPLLIMIAVLVRVKLGKPILFRQRRIGLHGRPFDLVKFRTMTNARDASGQLLPDEVRLTPFGQWLRATSIDELPELWNILTGKMSLVGPRPLLPEYMPFYTENEATRHHMRPGITGLAQISGRNGIDWDTRLALDATYVRQFRFIHDLRILWRTAAVVLHREGISAQGEATMQRLDIARAKNKGAL